MAMERGHALLAVVEQFVFGGESTAALQLEVGKASINRLHTDINPFRNLAGSMESLDHSVGIIGIWIVRRGFRGE